MSAGSNGREEENGEEEGEEVNGGCLGYNVGTVTFLQVCRKETGKERIAARMRGRKVNDTHGWATVIRAMKEDEKGA